MSYTKENLMYADEVIASRRTKAETERAKRQKEIAAKIPDIPKYEAQMAESGLAVAKAFGMGKDAQKYIEDLADINLKTQEYIRTALVNGGYPADYLDTPYYCKKCGDTGYVGGYFCSCRKELLDRLTLEDLERVSPAGKCTFDNFRLDYYPEEPDATYGISPREKMSEIFEYCKCYAEDFGTDSGSLYMRGETGLGKTHLSLAIANVAARSGFNVVYGSAQNLLSEVEREKFGGNNSGAAENKLLSCDLLIIDDLGSEFATQFTLTVVYNIINTRINTSKPVIISTNLTDRELEAKYTARITSRIIGNYTSLYFMGRDIRQIKSQE